jgi:hypothetical protein
MQRSVGIAFHYRTDSGHRSAGGGRPRARLARSKTGAKSGDVGGAFGYPRGGVSVDDRQQFGSRTMIQQQTTVSSPSGGAFFDSTDSHDRGVTIPREATA